MRYAPFVPLRVLSSYSMLEGAIDPKGIAKLAKERGFPAIAICDRDGLYGAVMFASACKGEGVQPIVGALLGVARDGPSGAASQGAIGSNKIPIDYLPLFAQDERGYDNLCHLVSRAHLDRPLEFDPHVTMDDLEGRTDGLIALTGAGEGALTRLLAEGQDRAAKAVCDRLDRLFPGRLYVEIARAGDPVCEAAEEALIDLAYARELPLVATNPANFAEPHMHKAHDAMLCIAHSSQIEAEDRPHSNPQAFVKSDRMMAEIFADLPEATANTLVIAQRCAYAPPDRAPILPSLAGDLEGEAAMLAADSRAGLQVRLEPYGEMAEEERRAYFDRLDYEIGIIVKMGFPGYFLIVADFIKWAKEQGIPVGPGRGSGAGSLVAWALTITDLDPIRLGLLFERFLNPERVSMPDFDIDFCETRRGEVIRYVQKKYGHDHVAQIITFGKLKARAVLRDCGRILQMSYGQVDRLCKMVPNHPTDPWTLPRALNGAPDFKREYDNDNEVRRLIDLAMQLEGMPRNSSTHAAGVVIGDRPLSQLVPLYRDPRSDMPVTQYDMKHVESSGLVKFDFLGLKTLSVLRKAVDLLALRGIDIDLGALTLDDPAVYELMQVGNTVGVFQLESEGMRRTLKAVKPTNFGDIIALVSLYRPGPMDNIPLFGRRKAGVEPIEYPHEKLAGILEETYGIFVYQEQVMQAAQILAGYSLGDADLLRRAMGKKNQAEMDKQRAIFIEGCARVSGIEAAKANELFDLINKFAGYGFNKSHAAAYALLAYQTAWLKAHYPEEFYAASMCFDMHQSEKLAVFVDDARRYPGTDGGIEVLPPDINASEARFTVEQTERGYGVRYALAGIRNVGEKAMEAIVAERQAKGKLALANARLEEYSRTLEQKVAQRTQALTEANQQLQQYTQDLEAQNAELDAFAHTVAHDLKSPLTSLVGFSTLLEQRYARMEPEQIDQSVRVIAQNGRRMTNIIDELLLLASVRKVEEVEIRPVEMAPVVAEAQARLVTLIEAQEARIVVPERWPLALGYAPWVEEVWVNYVSNALKYGGKPPCVELGADPPTNGAGKVRFWVRDNGHGLTEKQSAQLFTQFKRLHESQAEGYGLGLSIVKRIIQKLGGEVGVESEVGRGSTFWFTLPAAPHATPVSEQAPARVARSKARRH